MEIQGQGSFVVAIWTGHWGLAESLQPELYAHAAVTVCAGVYLCTRAVVVE